MFTGIVTALGMIEAVVPLSSEPDCAQSGVRLVIEASDLGLEDVGIGDSIAIQGACMTVVDLGGKPSSQLPGGRFAVDVSRESLSKTAGLAQMGSVNLEKALRLSDRLGGHLVSGHVDGLGRVAEFIAVGESWRLAIDVPAPLARYFAYKGSVTVNGVSLTVNRVVDDIVLDGAPWADSPEGLATMAPLVTDGGRVTRIEINVIPHTMAVTTLGRLKAGDPVNLEVDQIARYCERLLAGRFSGDR
jgi:riboflavin synthase